jgi:hypothetical protein
MTIGSQALKGQSLTNFNNLWRQARVADAQVQPWDGKNELKFLSDVAAAIQTALAASADANLMQSISQELKNKLGV